MPITFPKASDNGAPSIVPDGLSSPSRPTLETIRKIQTSVDEWREGPGKYNFTVFVGQYSGGNWNSTVEVKGDQVVKGSLPNLIYYLDKFSNGRIRGNEKNIRIIRLDSEDLLKVRPPFIFLTGTQDFKLTEKEVQNLRNYLLVGGAIWGDSSVPGKRSRFDIAFRREMKRVVPDKDKEFEPIPQDHVLYKKGYFPGVREVAKGLNYYKEPVYALKVYGQVCIIYTANDYGDMWQIGLYENPATKKIEMDTRQNEHRQYVASNGSILNSIGNNYLHNLSAESLETSYQFGGNIIVHLLGRWDDLIRTKRL